MRLNELEKVAFSKEARFAERWADLVGKTSDAAATGTEKLVNLLATGVGKGTKAVGKTVNAGMEAGMAVGKGVGKGVAAPFYLGKKYIHDPVVKPVVKGAGNIVGKGIVAPITRKTLRGISNSIAENPLGFGVKAITTAAVAPMAYDLASYKNYNDKIRNPVVSRGAGEFGNRGHPFLKESSMKNSRRPLGELEKIAALDKEAGLFSALGEKGGNLARKMGFGTQAFWPTLAVLGTGIGASAALLGPTLRTTGEQLQKGIYSPDKRINKEDELAKMRMMTLDKFDIDRELKAKEKAYKTQTVYPQAMDVLQTLKSKDPMLSEAAKDKKLNTIMGKTVETVYSFAPDVSKDERAMQSVLTEAVTSPEGGLSFQTIKGLAETQKAITQGKGKGTK